MRLTALVLTVPFVGGTLATFCFVSQVPAALPATPSTPPSVAEARRVQELFAARCIGCHGPAVQQGGLRLDEKTRAYLGGDSGKVFVPGKSAESELLRRLTAPDPKRRMPPGKPLSPAEIALVARWIDAGAPWVAAPVSRPQSKVPGRTAPRLGTRDSGLGTAPSHWSFRPIAAPVLPEVRNNPWVRNPIDRFVLARLEQKGLRPSPEADPATLIRRLYLDLLGLPPTPAEVDRFIRECRAEALGRDGVKALGKAPDNSSFTRRTEPPQRPNTSTPQHPDSAYERLVDRLLASPHFGERWGRHWLDLARYADSDGYENDRVRPNAWRYRDWVVDAINRDLPFDQFTLQQLAGDLLPNPAPAQRVATGFHLNALSNSAGGADREEFRVKGVKDRLNAVGTVWMGLTVGCAQCHTHKYDPVLHREYYGLYAFFNSTEDAEMEMPGGKALVLAELKQARPAFIHLRGDFLRPGEAVQPQTPAFLPPLRPRGTHPDRLDLARWLVRPEHPLTARVAVNHVWQHLFGVGLVPTPENLGKNGDRPTHPELLDWLAARFVGVSGSASQVPRQVKTDPGLGMRDPRLPQPWSRKALIRLIVTSAAYRQSARHRADLDAVDPRNVLLGRQNRFRVEAEVVRDLALGASGLLNPAMGGPGFQPPLPAGIARLPELKGEVFLEPTPGDARYRRGLYIHVQRTFPNPTLATFDSADANLPCTRRDRSSTPLQALTLLNDPVFFECAQALSRRVLRETALTDESRLQLAFRLCLGREPEGAETAALRELLAHHRALYSRDAASARAAAGAAPLPFGVTIPEAAAWTGIARTLMNLEEFLTRE